MGNLGFRVEGLRFKVQGLPLASGVVFTLHCVLDAVLESVSAQGCTSAFRMQPVTHPGAIQAATTRVSTPLGFRLISPPPPLWGLWSLAEALRKLSGSLRRVEPFREAWKQHLSGLSFSVDFLLRKR